MIRSILIETKYHILLRFYHSRRQHIRNMQLVVQVSQEILNHNLAIEQ